jgi:pilus assembly protein Flp/PilA
MYYILNVISALYARVDSAKDRGATATEYAILVALIAVIITAGVGFFGDALNKWFHDLAGNIGL